MEKFIPPGNGTINGHYSTMLDKKGFLWFGTDNGLVRYDGSAVRNYPYNPDDNSSIGGTITSTISQYGDSLLIGFRGDGIDIFDPITEKFSHFRAGEGSELPSNFIATVNIDKDKLIWISFQQKSDVYCFQIRSGKLSLVKQLGLNKEVLYDVDFFRDGFLISTDASGIIYYNLADGKTTKYNTSNCGISSDIVYELAVANDSVVWISTASAFERIIFRNEKIVSITPFNFDNSVTSYVNAIAIDPYQPNQLWISRNNIGISRIKEENGRFVETVSGNFNKKNVDVSVQSLVFDNSHVLWAGTENSGIYKINTSNAQFNDWPNIGLYESVIGNMSVNCLFEDSHGVLWVGSESNGLIALDFQNNNSHHFSLPAHNAEVALSNSIRGIVELDNGEIWFATQGNGVFAIPNTKNTSDIRKVEIPGLVGGILIRHMLIESSNLWIATRSFLLKYNIKDKSSKIFKVQEGLVSNRTRHLYLYKNQHLWVGTDEGLSVLNLDTEVFSNFVHRDEDSTSLSNNQIRSVLVDSKGQHWIGTRGGFNQFRPADSTFTRFPLFMKYNVNTVYSIYENGSYLWMSTNNGVIRFDPETYDILQFKSEDGLASDGFEYNNSWQSASGRLYFGSSNGINTFFPEKIKPNEFVPPVYVTGIYVNQTLVDYYPNDKQKSIQLTYTEKNLRFVFSALDYTIPFKNQYKFMLENFDADWQLAIEDNTAKYTNLDPGEYTFRVLGSNNHGVWNNEGDSILVVIQPPWWRTTWARYGFLAAIVFSFVATQYLLSARKTKMNKKLTRIVGERTQELQKVNAELVDLYKEIQTQNEEIQAQNEELVSNVEEISAQRDDVEQQHLTVLKLKRTLDKVNTELRKANNSLEGKVKERTSHLEKANAELDRFVYSASHDLSAPLKSIRGLLYLERIDPAGDHDRYYKMISESIDKLEDVIKSLLQFSRNANKSVVFESFHIRQFLEEIINDLQFLQPDRKVKVTIDGSEDMSWFLDEYRLRLILGNLISNAMKYIDTTKETNRIDIKYGETKTKYTLKIIDNGIGIDNDQLTKIFEMFYRATDRSTGSGLGLYIAREAIVKMNGRIDVSSTQGLGSTFSITIPKNDRPEN